jgi:Sulfotransferase domain
MIVLCNGMPRSASTWSYNVAVDILRKTTREEVVGGYDESLDRFLQSLPPSAAHAVVKSHFLDATGTGIAQLGGAKVIYTWRDLADAIASLMAMFGVEFDSAIGDMSKSLDLYRRHRRHGALILSYESITTDPEGSVRKVASHLNLDASDEAIAEVSKATSFHAMRERVQEIGSQASGQQLVRHEGTSYDPTSLLHVNHIRNGGTGYGATALSRGQLRQIDRLLREKGPLE